MIFTTDAHEIVLVTGLHGVAKVKSDAVCVEEPQNLHAIGAAFLIVQLMVFEIGHGVSFSIGEGGDDDPLRPRGSMDRFSCYVIILKHLHRH